MKLSEVLGLTRQPSQSCAPVPLAHEAAVVPFAVFFQTGIQLPPCPGVNVPGFSPSVVDEAHQSGRFLWGPNAPTMSVITHTMLSGWRFSTKVEPHRVNMVSRQNQTPHKALELKAVMRACKAYEIAVCLK